MLRFLPLVLKNCWRNRRRTSLTLVTGIDHVRFTEMTAEEVRRQVRSAREQGGATRFFLAPGCSLPTYAYPPLIRAARAAASA